MLKKIIKRNGETENFVPAKLNVWSQWAAKDLGDRIDWSEIVLATVKTCGETIHSQELQKQLIKHCVAQKKWAYSIMAGRLYNAMYRKELYFGQVPSVKELHERLANLKLMSKLNYSRDDYAAIEQIIDHSRDFNMAYFQVQQIRKKYALQNKVTKEEYETPQFVFMRMAMALAEDERSDRLVHVKNWYDHFSYGRLNAPTPNYVNLGTEHNGYASCCLYTTDDTARSLAIGDHIAYTMTYMSSGIGGYIGSRSLNDPVRSGSVLHRGKLPYFKSLAASVNANLQAGRGGAATSYYSCFDPEVKTITMLQNPRTPIDKQNRSIHFAIMTNRLFAKKVARNEDIFVFNRYTCPELHTLFFSDKQDEFEKVYEEYEQNALFKKEYISAREICIMFMQQGHEVATLYHLLIDETNRHTPYKEPIYSSNLCVAPETPILTKEYGYRKIATLVGQFVHVWNGEKWSKTQVCKTGENQSLVTVRTTDGVFDCTLYHRWSVATFNDEGIFSGSVIKTTRELVSGDKLISYDLGIVDHGDKELSKEPVSASFIPDSSYKLSTRIKWFTELSAIFCSYYRSSDKTELFLASRSQSFLINLRLMLQELGIHSNVDEQNSDLLRTKITWYVLTIKNNSVAKLVELGFKIDDNEDEVVKNFNDSHYPEILSINDKGRCDDTYCFTEPERGMGMFAGVLTMNCIEVTQATKPYEHMSDLYRSESVGQINIKTNKGVQFIFPHSRLLLSGDGKEFYASEIKVNDKIRIHDEHHIVTEIVRNKHEPEVSLCSLAGVVVSNIENDEQYASAAYYGLKMIDKCIHKSYYELPHIGYTAKSRLNAGVGMLGLAHHLARLNLKYNTPEGLKEIHKVSERHAYFIIKASLQLGQELGNAPWIHKTKWPEGWLPIDTYKKSVDLLVKPEYQYDWEELRSAIIANKGIRNSSLIAHMPTESSSKASGAPNSIYPVRDLSLKKTDSSNVLDWCAPDNDLIENQYQLAWELSFKEMTHVYAVVQKFTDQSISADFYKDRSQNVELSSDELITDYLELVKYGVKSKYYQNSYTPVATKLDEISENTGISFVDIDKVSANQRGCSGDSCTL